MVFQTVPLKVKQGALGDCWLLGSIGALAMYPAKIKGLFDTKQLSNDGKYGVTRLQVAMVVA